MEPNITNIDYDYKEKQRLKNVKEYQKKFFNKINKHKKNRRK